jgi:peptidoglycan/LPS O-acetylase OafA/YrhL
VSDLKKYRPDIDGLRAIAVLAVVFYHFNIFPTYSKSGFIGVDIFFVISGYLITNILISDTSSKHWIRRFYIRRVRRIFPALILVLFTTVITASLVMLPFDFKIFGQEILGGSTFSSNIVYLQQVGYFDQSSYQKPLLHLWSLGIEEQFYIFWPILIWVISKLRLRVTLMLGILTISSFLYCVWISTIFQDLAFYSPFSRAWELAVGGLIASFKIRETTKIYRSLGNLGLLLLAASFLYIDNEKTWPSLLTVLPVLGALMILADSSKRTFKHLVLSNKILVYVGRISFPLYLWHWPLFVFFKIYKGESPDRYEKVSLFVSSILLASLTYHFLELPIKKRHFARIGTRSLSFAMTLVTISGVVLTFSNGFPSRFSSQMSLETSRQLTLQFSPPSFQDQNCLNKFPNPKSKEYGWWFCRTSSVNPPTILLWGNSFANQYFEGLKENSYFRNQSILSIGDCSIQREPDLENGNPCAGGLWKEQRNFVKDLIRSTPSIDYVIVAGLKEVTNALDAADLESTLTFLNEQGKRTIVFYPHLKPMNSIYSCIDRPFFGATWDCEEPITFRKELNSNFSSSFRLITQKFPSTLIFDPNDAFCERTVCEFMKDGVPLLRDTSPHISQAGSRLVAEVFADWAQSNLNFS